MKVIRLIGLISGLETPLDGQYLVEYDPRIPGSGANGAPMIAHIVVTPDESKAHRFPSAGEALECWKRSHGTRPDGEPNRPLSAFSVEVLDAKVQ